MVEPSPPLHSKGDRASPADQAPIPLPSPSLTAESVDGTDVKRAPSIQFDRSPDGRKLSTDIRRSQGRKKSPPPAPKFEHRVAFDTFEKPDAAFTSFTITRKHVDFKYTKGTRTFLCGLDDNDYSEYALEWLIDELVDDHDEIVCLRVVDRDSGIANSNSIEKLKYREEADKIMDIIVKKNHENKALNLILEFAVGKVEKVIMSMIKLYEPALLIVGTRGRNLGGIQGLLPGSVSKYCLQNSPIPVIVVRPNSQRARGKRKRANDPARQYYRDLLDKTAPDGSMENFVHPDSPTMAAVEDEAAAVAKALGIPGQSPSRGRSPGGSPGSRLASPGVEKARRSPLVQVTSAEEVATVNSLKAKSGKPIEPENLLVDEVDAKETLGDIPLLTSDDPDVAKTEEKAAQSQSG